MLRGFANRGPAGIRPARLPLIYAQEMPKIAVIRTRTDAVFFRHSGCEFRCSFRQRTPL